jgi:predicted DNA-binding ribbon-helix-helix protein
MGRVMKNKPVCDKCGAPRAMDASELRGDLAYRLAHWRGTSRRENRRFYRDLSRLARLAKMSVEALLTELHQDAELIDE